MLCMYLRSYIVYKLIKALVITVVVVEYYGYIKRIPICMINVYLW